MPKMVEAVPAYVGIDPGASGGVAVITAGRKVMVSPMPDCPYSLAQLLRGYEDGGLLIGRVCMEKVGGYVKPSVDGEVGGGQPGSAAFKFGRNVGRVEGVLAGMGRQLTEEVVPSKWQKHSNVSPRKKGEKKSQFKARIRARAQQLFPCLKVTLKTCDALLIALYCLEKHA